jgi:uncharacterized protein RhaS with RHS repeats
MHHYGYRYYNPQLGRWINRDPIGETGGGNVYGYVMNNPLVLLDALGQESIDCKRRLELYEYARSVRDRRIQILATKCGTPLTAIEPNVYYDIGEFLVSGSICTAGMVDNAFAAGSSVDISWLGSRLLEGGIRHTRLINDGGNGLKYGGRVVGVIGIAYQLKNCARADSVGDAVDPAARAVITAIGMTGAGAPAALLASAFLFVLDIGVDATLSRQERRFREAECDDAIVVTKLAEDTMQEHARALENECFCCPCP